MSKPRINELLLLIYLYNNISYFFVHSKQKENLKITVSFGFCVVAERLNIQQDCEKNAFLLPSEQLFFQDVK